VIDGQKIWTSLAEDASWIFLLARTDPDARGHRGISFLLCPMDQPGIEVRPIEMLNHEREFCEVFFDGARTAAQNVVGEIGGGWAVAMTLLSHERGEEAAINPILFRAEFDRLVALARTYGRLRDPFVRDRLAWCFTAVETMRVLGYRILTEYLRDGELGPAASISKLYWSEYHQRASELAMHIMGPDGLVPTGSRPVRNVRTDAPHAPNSTASWTNVFLLNARAGTVSSPPPLVLPPLPVFGRRRPLAFARAICSAVYAGLMPRSRDWTPGNSDCVGAEPSIRSEAASRRMVS